MAAVVAGLICGFCSRRFVGRFQRRQRQYPEPSVPHRSVAQPVLPFAGIDAGAWLRHHAYLLNAVSILSKHPCLAAATSQSGGPGGATPGPGFAVARTLPKFAQICTHGTRTRAKPEPELKSLRGACTRVACCRRSDCRRMCAPVGSARSAHTPLEPGISPTLCGKFKPGRRSSRCGSPQCGALAGQRSGLGGGIGTNRCAAHAFEKKRGHIGAAFESQPATKKIMCCH